MRGVLEWITRFWEKGNLQKAAIIAVVAVLATGILVGSAALGDTLSKNVAASVAPLNQATDTTGGATDPASTATMPPTSTPTDIPLPTATASPTLAPTPAPTAAPASSDNAQVGGSLPDFIAKYGQPINPGGSPTNFYADSAQSTIVGVDTTNGVVTRVSVSADYSWDDVQTYNFCYQFLPVDASLFNKDGQVYDYNTSLGEVVLDNLGSGQCMVYEAAS